MRDDALPSTNGNFFTNFSVLPTYFLFFFLCSNATRRPAERCTICRYMYIIVEIILSPRACAEKKKPYAHTLTRAHTHGRTYKLQYSNAVNRSICALMCVRVFICACVRVCVARARTGRSYYSTSRVDGESKMARLTRSRDTTTVRRQRGCKRI